METKTKYKQVINNAITDLNVTLREELVDTGLVTIPQWNLHIAPKLKNLVLAMEESTLTARTFKLPESYPTEKFTKFNAYEAFMVGLGISAFVALIVFVGDIINFALTHCSL